MSEKVCSICKKSKPTTEFYKNKKGRLGVCGRCKECDKQYKKDNREKYQQSFLKYKENNKEKHSEYMKKYKEDNKESIQEYMKDYNKNYRENNKEKIRENQRKRRDLTNKKLKERRKLDPLFKLKGTLRNRIYTMFKFKDWKKNRHTEEILGASYEDVKMHIESTFTEGMTWDNHGEWHIDHKVPLDSAKTEEELYKLCHYTNLQALWAFDNLSKNNRF